MDKTLAIQEQIKQNSYGIQDYMSELGKWEKKIGSKDAAIKKKRGAKPAAPAAPRMQAAPRNSEASNSKEIWQPSEAPKGEEAKRQPAEGEESEQVRKYKRDIAPMKDYYRAWDNFDIDQALGSDEEDGPKLEQPKQSSTPARSPNEQPAARSPLDPPAPMAPVRSKMIIKGGRGQGSEMDRLKDEGNLFFSQLNFDAAIESYTKAFLLKPSSALQVILFSNRAQCYLKLRDHANAEADWDAALELDPEHVKSLNRLQQAKRMNGRYNEAMVVLNRALEVEPGDKFFTEEKNKVEQIQQKKKQVILDIMNNPHRVPSKELERLKVKDINGEENITTAKIEEAKSLALSKIDITQLGQPGTIAEFEKQYYTFIEKPNALTEYLKYIDIENFRTICSNASIESSLIMSLLDTLPNLLPPATVIHMMTSISTVERFDILVKFLSRREKERVRGLIAKTPELSSLQEIFKL